MSFSDYTILKIEDVCEVIDSLHKSPKYVDEGYPMIRVKDLSKGYLKFDSPAYVTKDVYEEFNKKHKPQKGDIIFSRVGSYGIVSLVNCDTDFCLGQNTVILTHFKKDKVDNIFLYYLLTSNIVFEQIEKFVTGSTQKTISMKSIKSIECPLPIVKKQKAIADILSSLDDKIELNHQMNKTLEEMAQALFKRWFVDFEFPNEEGQPYKSSGGEMVESEVRMIPKGWDIATLDNICSLMTKSVKPFENPEVLYEHFSLPACDEGKLPVMEFGNQISSNKYMINNSCILISKLNPATKRIWDPVCKENSICSTEFMVYQPKNSGIKPFCYELINSDRFTEYLLCNVTGSTGSRQRVQPKLTLKYPFVISNSYLVEEFSSLVKPMHDKIKVNIEENRILKKTRDTLLPKLMSGEIRVSDLKS